MTQKSFLAKPGQVTQKWYHVDATGKTLGRLAADIAMVLMGKNKPEYTPHIDVGDYVIVTNVDKIEVSGKKAEYKEYQFYSGYPGGLSHIPFKRMMERKPEEVLRLAVRRMLPKNRLSRKRLMKLKLHVGPTHDHQAQQPEPWPHK